MIFRFGPLVCHWTMRFEAKHSYFKCLSESMGNFINLPYSLSIRHQEYQCYLHRNTKELSGDVGNINVGPGKGYLHLMLSLFIILFNEHVNTTCFPLL